MPLPASAPERTLRHRRRINAQRYVRRDVVEVRDSHGDAPPLPIARSGALRAPGKAVRRLHPRWHRLPAVVPEIRNFTEDKR